jgi:hypothetical protein
VLLPVIVPTSARGYDWKYEEVVLLPNNLGKDRAFVAAYLRRYGPWSPGPPYSAIDDPQELKKMLKGLRVARYDLTGDGKPELIVGDFGSEWCGSAGCTALIFELRDGRWQFLARNQLGEGRTPGTKRLFIARSDFPAMESESFGRKVIWHNITVPAVVDGHKTFFNYTGGHYWDGEKYRFFCLDRCGYEDG